MVTWKRSDLFLSLLHRASRRQGSVATECGSSCEEGGATDVAGEKRERGNRNTVMSQSVSCLLCQENSTEVYVQKEEPFKVFFRMKGETPPGHTPSGFSLSRFLRAQPHFIPDS